MLHDETEDLVFPPELVVVCSTVPEISELVRYCNEHRVPLTVRGAGTGLSGAALAVEGGICLSMEDLIRSYPLTKQICRRQSNPVSSIRYSIRRARKKACSICKILRVGSSFIGGNLALNAGGPKAVKYGVTNAYVLNLEVVLPDGSVIWTGANTLKNSTGYNLTQLMVGSEGTLGIITKAVFRLLPYPKFKMLMLAPFSSAESACASVSAIFRAGLTPSGLEFMERDAIEYTLKFVPNAPVPLDRGLKPIC